MLSQVGCITLPTEVNEAAYQGKSLEPEDQKAFDNHPVVAAQLISNIPRLEGVAWIIAHQRPSMSMDHDKPESVLESAEILRVALALTISR